MTKPKLLDDNCRYCGSPLNGVRYLSYGKCHRLCRDIYYKKRYSDSRIKLINMDVDKLLNQLKYNEIEPLKVPMKDIKNWSMVEEEIE